ncbi:hypothetical protein H2204_001726 [Knufia peltigerae]|uniref:C2H2-type domain-containing protein n=1 Tax=Knufia peltigerae TaxID=1002370 RepID=A0AA38YEK9_9EURO|nr:hypothetical protein H2204_001726 [Knufia peltigerae]
MKFEDIQISLKGDEEINSNLVANVVLRYTKFEKKSNQNRTRRVECLKNTEFNTIDLVLLLVAHGLRHGLFQDGTTLDEILAAANARGDRTLRWKHPSYPLVPSQGTGLSGVLTLNRPTNKTIAMETIKRMGDLAGYLPELLAHDVRRGSAKDLSRLPTNILRPSTEGVARAMGHTNVEANKPYNEDEDEALSVHKPALPVSAIDSTILQVTSGYTMPSHSAMSAMVFDYIRQNSATLLEDDSPPVSFFLSPAPGEDDPMYKDWKKPRKAVAKIVKTEHRNEWVKVQSGVTADRAAFAELYSSQPVASGRTRRPSSGVQTRSSKRVATANQPSLPTTPSNADFDLFSELENDTLGTLCDETTVVAELSAMNDIHPTQVNQSILDLDATEFVLLMSRYNVTLNQAVRGGRTPSPENWEGKVSWGNTRDDPTRFMFKCPNCDSSFYMRQKYENHREICADMGLKKGGLITSQQEEQVAAREHETKQGYKFKCQFAEQGKCDKGPFQGSHQLAQHMHTHEFVKNGLCARREECSSDEIFQNISNWRQHLLNEHSEDRVPERACPRPDLGCNKIFQTLRAYNSRVWTAYQVHDESYTTMKLDKSGSTAEEKENMG